MSDGQDGMRGAGRIVPDAAERDRVARCVRGDEAAWAEVYRLHGPGVARFLSRLLGGDDGLEDLVQDVFVTVLTTLPRYRGEARLSTWILGVAAHVASHHRRGTARRGRRLVLSDRPEEADGSAWATGAEADVAGGADARAELRVVAATLEALPVDLRATWLLAEGEGLEAREVAAALGIPEGTVRSRLFHARRRMLEALARAGFDRAPAGTGRDRPGGDGAGGDGAGGPRPALRLVGSGTGR